MRFKGKSVIAGILFAGMLLVPSVVYAEENAESEGKEAFDGGIEAEVSVDSELRGWNWDNGWFYYDNDGTKATGWRMIGQYWYYFDDENGEIPGLMLSDEKREINGETYFFGSAGNMLTGWILREEGWYYLNSSGRKTIGWVISYGGWYYMDGENTEYPGLMATDCYKEIGGNTYAFYSTGLMRTGWYYDSGCLYFNPSGHMVTGWEEVSGYWYYLDPENGSRMCSDSWKEIDGRYFYFYPYGNMATGWIQIEGKWYFMSCSYGMQTQWIYEGGCWYYLGDDGVMQTGWIKDQDKWFYLYSYGAMAQGWTQIGGKWYYINCSYGMQTGWLLTDGYWYYLDDNGVMQTGWIKVQDEWYYLYPHGVMARGWIKLDGTWYYLNRSGAWEPDKQRGIFIGIDREDIVEELKEHQYDSYYLGTRYAGLNLATGNKDVCMHPNGSPGANGYIGMNCTGFVAFVCQKCGGDLSEIDAMGRIGGYVNATSWLDYAKRTGKRYYVYNSISALLLSGQAQKGDIIYCEPDWSKPGADCHIGFFWGENSWDNAFWHQVQTNIISNIKAGTPQIRYYLIKTSI